MSGLDVEAINLENGDYLAADGVIYPIVAYLDGAGDECEWFDAASAVAGAGSRWWSIDLAEFKGAPC